MSNRIQNFTIFEMITMREEKRFIPEYTRKTNIMGAGYKTRTSGH